MSTPRPPSLSKSKFMLGRQCHLRLWWTVHEPDAPELEVDDPLQARFDRGSRVGELARQQVPGGVLIDLEPWRKRERVAATRAAIARGAPAVYEASFEENGVFVAVDILERVGADWNVIEVKQAGEVKDHHVPDVALQSHVVRRAGLSVGRSEVMHLHSGCRFPDLSDLFVRADVTEQVATVAPELPDAIAAQLRILAGPRPDVPAGAHCHSPWECPFLARCHPEPPPHPVEDLNRASPSTRERIEALGVRSLIDLPSDFELTEAQERQVRAIKEGRRIIEPGLREALSRWQPPFAYLDFETIQPFPPRWDGCGPFTQVPVQWSVHRREVDGSVTHHEWLFDGEGDPRRRQVDALLAATAGAECVIAYSASFEARCLRHLAACVPERADDLLDLAGRLVDLLPIVRGHVADPGFGSGFSLKSVVPALLPELAYSDLAIADGATASDALDALTCAPESLDGVDLDALRADLLRYCERDTLVLVRLHELLSALWT